ncbi:MAG: hypothetical protein NXH95_02595 [Pseudomonadaceae bacterium]|nr:hypothetical protein [Pseudomonadaceae bacterium]
MKPEIPLDEFEKLDPEPPGYQPYTTHFGDDVMRLEALVLEGWSSGKEVDKLKGALKRERQLRREAEAQRIKIVDGVAAEIARALIKKLEEAEKEYVND